MATIPPTASRQHAPGSRAGAGIPEAPGLTRREVATLHPIPNVGALFVGWTIDNVFDGWSNPREITMNADHTGVAYFATRPSFPDVSISDPAYEDGNFGPNDSTLRAQMAALIARSILPIHMYHLGLWFNSPADATAVGCPGASTPFNGDHTAGVQVLNTSNYANDQGPLRQPEP